MAGKAAEASAEASVTPRTPLSREQVLRAAITVADESGIDALSMRKLGRILGVEAMSLYNHVAGKDDLLDGMVDVVWDEVPAPSPRGDWRAAIRKTAVSAHRILLRHHWAGSLTISLGRGRPGRLRYIDAILGRLHKAGLSDALAFHAYHAIDCHIIGFTTWYHGHSIARAKREESTELPFDAGELPHLAEHARQHRAGVGSGTDEFTLILDLILDGLETARTKN